MEITKRTATDCAVHITEALKPVLKLHDWDIIWRFEQMDRLAEGSVQLGQAHVDYNHLKLIIYVDTFRHEDDFTDFVDTLRHELLHATHFMWTRALTAFREMLPQEYEKIAAAHWADACEEHVAYFGRVLDGLGYHVDALATSFVDTLAENAPKE